MTDLSHPSEPQSADDLPQNGGALPRRKPFGEPLPQSESQPEPTPLSHLEPLADLELLADLEPLARRDSLGQRDPLPQSSGSFFERVVPDPTEQMPRPAASEPLPRRAGDLPRRGSDLPQPGGEALPQRSTDLPQRSTDLPQRSTDLPQRNGDLPQRSTDLPQRSTDLPQRSTDLPQRGEALPQRNGDLPQRGEALPQRNGDLPQRNGLGPLPRRTMRTQRTGRHRSPHRLSVASDAPALVIAVPGAASADTADIGAQVAVIAEQSCPGVVIRVGYLDGPELSLAECLHPDGADSDEQDQFPSVVVPLLLSPSPAIDTRIQQLAAQAALPAIVAPHLGPHPLIAEALHARLAEAGLARQARSSGLSISADGRGIVVLADIGEEAASGAAVAAVLLASRLSVPVVPASLGDPSSIVDAVNRLTDSGAARPVLAPCLIGPETNVAVLSDLSAALDAPCAPVLGAHQAIGQLVAIRYGTALTSLSLAG